MLLTVNLPKHRSSSYLRRVRVLIAAILFSLARQLPAQIHADFTVSHGVTPVGTFRARLDYDKAPRTCANFIGLANGTRPWIDVTTGEVRAGVPFYDGLTFHRLIHDFMIQGGSPNGLGTDGPGFSIQDEFHPSLRHNGRYVLSMAKSSLPASGGSQFFITLEDSSMLDDKHSVFGEVTDGRAIFDLFASSTLFPTDRSYAGAPANDPNYSDTPLTPIVIDSVVISGPSLAAFDIDDPALRLPHVVPQPTLAPSRDALAETFSFAFERQAQTEYLIFRSLDLQTWSPRPRILSVDGPYPYAFTFSGVPYPRYFIRLPAVDYGDVPNAPSDLTAAGRVLTFTDRSGNTVSLTFNGAGGGTWSDSLSGSGQLNSASWYDLIPASGASSTSSGFAPQLPLGQFTASFDTPAGANGWQFLNARLSFHEPLSGHADGSADIGASSVPAREAFTLSP